MSKQDNNEVASWQQKTIDELDWVSKSAQKRQAKSLRNIGSQLAELTTEQRIHLPLTDELQIALVLADKIRNKKEAYRRQLQYIGKIVRQLPDVQLETITTHLEHFHQQTQQQAQSHHHIEQLRQQLIEQGMPMINQLTTEYPHLERQKLRQLVKKAQQEVSIQAIGTGYRTLYKYLKQIIQD